MLSKYLPIALLLAPAACEHPAPFRPASYAPDSLRSEPPLTRLTMNPGTDFAPTWTPAGDQILFTAERIDRGDRDRCLAIFPASGASISRYLCRTTATDDSVNAFQEAAVDPNGRVAYVRVATHRFPVRPIAPDAQALVVASLDRPNDVQVVRTIAYTAPPPSGRVHQGISYIGWLGPARLVYLADSVTYPRACGSCLPDTVQTGLEIMTVDFGGASPVLETVPGTDSASSVAVGASGDTIYYTRAGKPHVFRYVFSAARADTVLDFTPGVQATDVDIANGRLVASVDGDLHFVTLATGSRATLTDVTLTYFYGRPALSPNGQRVVFERRRRSGGAADLMMMNTP